MIVLDPHGDVAYTLAFLHNLDRERLVYVSTSINREAQTSEPYTAIFNPFETIDKSAEMQNLLAQELTESISELLEDTSHSLTIQMTAVLRPCIATVLRSNEPSLTTLSKMMLDDEALLALGKTSPIQVHREFFERSFSLPFYALTKKSIHTKLLYFLGEPTLANMLNGRSTISFEKCLDEGKVVIMNLAKGAGKFSSSVVSRLCIAHLNALMLRRAGIDRKKRKKCFLFLDEFQTMVSGNGSLASSLAETRKYGLSLILATQSLKSLEKTTLRKTVMVNTGLKMVGLTDYEDRTTFAKEFDVPTETFSKLKPLHFVVKKNDGRHKAFTFRVPILARRYFLTKEEKKELLNWLVYDSGMYIKITPPPAPPPVQTTTFTKKKTTKKTTDKDNPFDDNLNPAF